MERLFVHIHTVIIMYVQCSHILCVLDADL